MLLLWAVGSRSGKLYWELQTMDCGLWTVDYGLQIVYLEGSTGVLGCGVFAGRLLKENEDGIGLPTLWL